MCVLSQVRTFAFPQTVVRQATAHGVVSWRPPWLLPVLVLATCLVLCSFPQSRWRSSLSQSPRGIQHKSHLSYIQQKSTETFPPPYSSQYVLQNTQKVPNFGPETSVPGVFKSLQSGVSFNLKHQTSFNFKAESIFTSPGRATAAALLG